MSDRDIASPACCQQCGKLSSAWRDGQGRSTYCERCRLPGAARKPVATELHPVIVGWLASSWDNIALASGGGIVLRQVGYSGQYRVAEFDTEKAAVLAISEGAIPWREVAPREPLTRNVEAVGSGLDDCHIVPHVRLGA